VNVAVVKRGARGATVSETYQLVFDLLETGRLVLAVLKPHYLATWGL
jgi:hypothetical protein